ncbi:MAG: multiubiquitin domain-containing protein [Sneathiella sp.]
MTDLQINTAENERKGAKMKFTIKMWNGDDFVNTAQFKSDTPSARQILDEFGFIPPDEHILLHVPKNGKLEEVVLDREFELNSLEDTKFIAFRSDRSFKLSLNERRMTWGDKEISIAVLRKLTGTDDDQEFVLERREKPDKVLNETDTVDLDDPGLERIYTRQRSWKLKVQDILLTVITPTIVVKDALLQAGIDPNTGWTAAIKYKGGEREAITLDGVIDLTRKGIEKLWLRPNQIQNGEDASGFRRAFTLRGEDEAYLAKSDLKLETMVENGRRWAILRQFPLPDGYTIKETDVAIDVPPTYPVAQIDMFYCYPHLARKSGGPIPQTQSCQTIEGQSYQRWSRHRHGATTWNPETDSIITHIAIIADAIAREVGQ